MKKLLLLSTVFFLLVLVGKAQELNGKPEKKYVYCELVGTGNLIGTKVTVQVDFGNKTKWNQDTRIKGEDGKPIKFTSMVDAMNYMGKEGWEFVQAYTITHGSSSVYHWLLKRTIESYDELEVASE